MSFREMILGLKDMPTSMVDVFVPKGTVMNVGRIGPQPSFGLIEKSDFQYQTVEWLPEASFQNIRPILQPAHQPVVNIPVLTP